MSPELVTSTREQKTMRVTLDSPGNRNALSEALLEQLLDAVSKAAKDPAVRVIVVGHSGSVFCSGADMREQLLRYRESGQSPGAGGLVPVLEALRSAPQPVVAEVRGAVRGGGMGLVAASDIAVAAENATFAFSEALVGVAPAVIAVPVLARIGRSAALELFLTGRAFSAQEARRIGLVSRVAPDGGVAAETGAVITELLRAAPTAQREIKQLLSSVPRLPSELAYEEMVALSQRLFSSPEGQEGMAAFREKRPPAWE